MTHGSEGQTYGREAPTDARETRPLGELVVVSGHEPSRPQRRRRRRDFTVIGVGVALLGVVAVVAYLLAGSLTGRGADSPEEAVDGFLSAIYEARDPRAAGAFVCDSARDDDTLDQIVFQVAQHEQAYTGARTTWSYPPIRTEGRRGAADVTLTMTTANEQVATRLVTLILVDAGGWWVCDVRTL